MNEIRQLGGRQTIISTNIPLRNDGLPYASFRIPADKGVAVYFTLKNEQMVFACDKWDKIEDNVQAIRKTIEALRGLDRWGVSEMLKRAFTGFKALGAPQGVKEQEWWQLLNLAPTATEEQIRARFRELAKLHHPDVTKGSHDYFTQIKNAAEIGLKQNAGK